MSSVTICEAAHEFAVLVRELSISVPQKDVVAGRGTGFEPDRVTNHERGGLRFGLADSARRGAPAITAVQPFMGQFVGKLIESFELRMQICGHAAS